MRSQAQTKEETISWIKDKFKQYCDHEELVKISECEIVVKFYIDSKKSKVWQEVTFPTNPVGFSADGLVYEAKSVKIVSKLGTEYENSIVMLMDFSREENLGDRFLKALRHLNTFCPKKKETF